MNGTKRKRTDSDATTGNRSQEQRSGTTKPQLTRACAECKRQKIRCFFVAGETSCTKCAKSGIQCVPHNFAQKFIDDDALWKADTSATIARLTDAVNHLLQHNRLPRLANSNNNGSNNAYLDIHDYSAASVIRCPDEANRGASADAVAPPPPPAVSPAASNVSSSAAAAATSGNYISEGPSADLQEYDSDLVPLPMNNLYSLTEPGKSLLIRVDPTCVNGPDFISRGVLSLDEAVILFDHFLVHINPLLWDGMLCAHATLEAARASSSLLVATVLTVAAMHLSAGNSGEQQGRSQLEEQRQQAQKPSLLHTTYDAFVQLMRASCLLRSRNLDDVRALCIGAFYLTGLSWALCSRAVRVATEMNLHKSSLQFTASGPPASRFSSAPSSRGLFSHGHEQYERVQLWYVLYVCDHQLALAYGRPPLMHDDAAIRNTDKLLNMTDSMPSSAAGMATSSLTINPSLSVYSAARGNRWLVAQVKLFRILGNAYFLYGCDPDLALGTEDYECLQSFNLLLDQWRLEQQQQSRGGAGSGIEASGNTSLLLSSTASRGGPTDCPALSKSVSTLYYHLARFQLNSLALRGIAARGTGADGGAGKHHGIDLNMTRERQEAANNAIAAATSTVRLIVEDAELRSMHTGMPIFVHAMVAVCASFLLKMAVVFSSNSTTTSKACTNNTNSDFRLPRDLARYGLNFHTKNALADVENLVRVLGVIADNASQQHVARQVVTGLRELLKRFHPGSQSDSFVYSRSDLHRSRPNVNGSGNVPLQGPTKSVLSLQQDIGTEHWSQAVMMQQQQVKAGTNGLVDDTENNISVYLTTPPQNQPELNIAVQQGTDQEYHEDPFNLMGDLDWRFNDAFLWGIQTDPQYL